MLWGKVEDTEHPGRDRSLEVNRQGPHYYTKSALVRAMWPGPGTIHGESKERSVIFFNLQAVKLRESICFQMHVYTRTHTCTIKY